MNRALERAIHEVVDLHQFFEDWFTGRLPQDEEAFQRFRSVTAPSFTLIGPDGAARSRADVLQWVWSIHGTRPDARLWVEDVQLATTCDTVYVVTYDEWQRHAQEQTVRISTAVLQADEATPNGLRWLHVHETWKKAQA